MLSEKTVNSFMLREVTDALYKTVNSYMSREVTDAR